MNQDFPCSCAIGPGAHCYRHPPQKIFGVKVIISPDRPKMQLSARVKEVLAPAFITETNAWMLGFFGTTNLLTDGQYLILDRGNAVTMNPRTYEMLRAATRKQ